MHPIHDAPDDVLREIFLHTKLDWGTDIYEQGPPELLKLVRIPWNISQVSRNWRAVATHIPQLWSIIVLDFTRCEEGSEDIWSEYLHRSLEWSRSSHLSVVLCSTRDILASSPSRALFASAHRWQRLIVDIPMAMHFALASHEPSFDVLKDVTIRNTAGELPRRNEGSVGLLKHTPKLDLVEMDADLLTSSILPLQRLTVLHTFGAQNMGTVSRLQAFSQLDDLILTFGSGSLLHFYYDLYLPVTMLAIYQDADGPVESIEEVFSIMVLPNLNDLSLYFERSLRLPSVWREYEGSMGFQILTIGGEGVDYTRPDDVEELVAFLSAATNVEELDIVDSPVSSQVISRLTLPNMPSDSSPLLPVLKVLECTIGPDDHEAMFEMVLSRIERVVPFQSLRLNSPLVLENAAKAAQWKEICASRVKFVHITEWFYD